MVKDSRIADWGLSQNVEFHLEGGLRDPGAIADKLNADANVQAAVGPQRVLPQDVRNYLKSRNEKKQEALAKSLQYSPEGRNLVEAARESIGWLVEQTEMLRGVMPRLSALYDTALSRAELAMQDPKNIDIFPTQVFRGLEGHLRLVKDIVESVKGDEKVQQILRAQTVNVNQGIQTEQLFDTLRRMRIECPNCGHRNADSNAVIAAWSRASAERRVLDANAD